MLRRIPGPQAGDAHLFNQRSPRHIPEDSTAPLHDRGVLIAGERITDRDDLPSGEHWERLFSTFEQLQNGIGALSERLWAEIPSWIYEWGYLASAQVLSNNDVTGGNTGTLGPQTTELEYILSVVAAVPSGDTGVIQLGNTKIPVGPGITVISPVRIPLFETDLRSLTVTPTAGAIGLYLSGQVGLTRGRMPL